MLLRFLSQEIFKLEGFAFISMALERHVKPLLLLIIDSFIWNFVLLWIPLVPFQGYISTLTVEILMFYSRGGDSLLNLNLWSVILGFHHLSSVINGSILQLEKGLLRDSLLKVSKWFLQGLEAIEFRGL